MRPPEAPLAVVTGAGGYLGGHVVVGLALSQRVRAVVRSPAPWLRDAEIVRADLAASDLRPVFEGASFVVHLGGDDEVRFAGEPDQAYANTVQATTQVACAAAEQGARVAYVSTVHVYGQSLVPGATIGEEDPTRPDAPYAVARLDSEAIVRDADPAAVVLRLTNAVGPLVHPAVDRWTLVANDLCRQAALTGEIHLRSPGTQWRDFVAVSDVVAAVSWVAGISPGTYNVASGRSSV